MNEVMDATVEALSKPENWIAGIVIGFVASKIEGATKEKMVFKQVHGAIDSALSAVLGIVPNAK